MPDLLFEVLCAPHPERTPSPGQGILIGCGGPPKCGSGCPKKRKPCPSKKERFVVAVSGKQARNTECSPYRAPDERPVLCIDLTNAESSALWVAELPHRNAHPFCRGQANFPPGGPDTPATAGLLVEVRNCSGRDIARVDLFANGVLDATPLPDGESRWFITASPLENTRFV